MVLKIKIMNVAILRIFKKIEYILLNIYILIYLALNKKIITFNFFRDHFFPELSADYYSKIFLFSDAE